jgi:hypothetical protein
LFGHPVPPGEHRMLSYFKYATHSNLFAGVQNYRFPL